jgi:hypothetical protein
MARPTSQHHSFYIVLPVTLPKRPNDHASGAGGTLTYWIETAFVRLLVTKIAPIPPVACMRCWAAWHWSLNAYSDRKQV